MARAALIGSRDALTAALAAAWNVDRPPARTATVLRGAATGLATRLSGLRQPGRDGEDDAAGRARPRHDARGPAPASDPQTAARLDAIYLAAARGTGELPDPEDARRVIAACAAAGVERLVVIASAAITVPNHHHLGMVAEADVGPRPAPGRGNGIALAWSTLEAAVDDAARCCPGVAVTVLRAATVPVAGGRDPWSRLLAGDRRLAAVPAGFDPPLQLLAVADLARASRRALAHDARPGALPERFHITPKAPVLLTAALRLAGVRRLPVPGLVLRLASPSTAARKLDGDRLAYLSHPWTVSGRKAARVLGFAATASSAAVAVGAAAGRRSAARPLRLDRWVALPAATTLAEERAAGTTSNAAPALPATGGGRAERALVWGPELTAPPDDWDRRYDPFGMDERFLRRVERTIGGFLHDRYWRVELAGLEHLPASGPALLVGVHRGFMPFDGVMAVLAARRAVGRTPRFLIHPSLVKLPHLAPAMMKLGGVPACRDHADRVLGAGGLLGIFPEGIRGAFSRYRDAYRLKKFGRDAFVAMALANDAPIVPFVTVGSAEIFPSSPSCAGAGGSA